MELRVGRKPSKKLAESTLTLSSSSVGGGSGKALGSSLSIGGGLAVSAGKSSKTKDGNQVAIAPRGTVRRLQGLLGLDGCCLMLIAEMLSPIDALTLAHTSKNMLSCFTDTDEGRAFWKGLLYSKEIDPFHRYAEGIPLEQRKMVEKVHGAIRVVSALVVNKCDRCRGYASSFNVLACARGCESCYQCLDSGKNGLGSKSPLALCSVGFAKKSFLVTDGQLKTAPTLRVADYRGGTKSTVMLVRDAVKLGESRWGGRRGVADELKRRSENSKNHADARANNICAHQRFHSEFTRSSAGHHAQIVGPEELCAPPTIFVTNGSPKQVSKQWPTASENDFKAGSCSIRSNLVEAFALARLSPGSTVVIDKHCDLDEDFSTCDKDKCACSLRNRNTFDVGGVKQRSMISIWEDVKIVGTARSSIHSTTASFWIQENVVADFSSLSITTSDHGYSPNIVNQEGIASFSKCRFDAQGGYCVLMHGKLNSFVDCTFVNRGIGVFHFNLPKHRFDESVVIYGCNLNFVVGNALEWAFFEDQEFESENGEKIFVAQVERDNNVAELYANAEDGYSSGDAEFLDAFGGCA